jgi:HTH-type transcriptional regulator, sugar sensing transcriptional regulator
MKNPNIVNNNLLSNIGKLYIKTKQPKSMDTSILEELGLSNAESRIYVALLELGSSTSGKIIDRTKLQSSTVYHLLGSLTGKGLVSFVLRGKIKYFQATPPENFLNFLDEKKRKFNDILPQLKELEKGSKQKQTARVYEGLNGLKVAFNDILLSLNKGDEYYFFQVPKKKLFDKKITLFFRNYHLKRAEKGIIAKGLAIKKSEKIVNNIFMDIKHTEIRFLEEFTPSGIIIYQDKVITLDWDDVPTAIVMNSKAIADSYKKFFMEKWDKVR